VTALCAQLPLRFQLSDLYGVPIGNLSGDLVAETLDVAVARALLQRGWPLDWLHRGDSLTLDVDTTSDAETWPQVSVPGAYSGICIDLEIQDLPLVAIRPVACWYKFFGRWCRPGSASKRTGTRAQRS
jgi:hypothetical protein